MSYREVDTNILDTVNVDLDTFQVFITKVNWIVDHLRNTVVTVSNTSAYDGNNTGNGYVFGIFGGNNIVATTSLRGGNVSTTGTLTITSNVSVTNTIGIANNLTVNGHSNVNTLFVRGQANVANVLNVTGNTTLQQDLTVSANTKVSGHLEVTDNYRITVVSNTNLGANITDPQALFSFAKTDYSSAKVMLQTKQGTNTQFLEAVIAHSGSTPLITVYAVVASPPASNNGVISASSNTTHILINYRHSIQNPANRAVIHMVK